MVTIEFKKKIEYSKRGMEIVNVINAKDEDADDEAIIFFLENNSSPKFIQYTKSKTKIFRSGCGNLEARIFKRRKVK